MAPPAKEVIHTSAAPLPLKPSPFCQAVKCGGIVYVSGNLGMDPATEKMVEGGVRDRTVSYLLFSLLHRRRVFLRSSHERDLQRQALRNISTVLEAAGTALGNVVKANVYLDDMANFAEMNEAWFEFFTDYVPVS